MKRLTIKSILTALLGRGTMGSIPQEHQAPRESPGIALRQIPLTTPASKLGFAPNAAFTQVYGIVTDWEVGAHIASILAMSDGTGSLYTNAAFGIIGGQGHAKVREAAIDCVKLAEQYVDKSNAVTEFPYPQKGQVNFYFLTYDGVRLRTVDLNALERGADPTRPLFDAVQHVLTELRIITEQSGAR